MKGSTWKWIAILFMGIILLSYFGYINFGAAPPGTQPPVTPPGTHESGQIQLQIVNSIGKAGVTTSTTTADFCQASNGVFDFLVQTDTMSHASNPDTYNVYYPEGAEVIIRVGCTGNPTNGLDYYDGWFYVKLVEGNPIYHLTKDMLEVVSTSPHYSYRVRSTAGAQTTGDVVTWTSGTTHYWDVGKLLMYPRLSAANFDTALSNQTHDLATVLDGSTWIDTAAEVTANWTLPSDDEKLVLQVMGGAADLGWGWPLYVIGQNGEFREYHSFILVSTAMTAIGNTKLANGGWTKINDGTLYTEVAYYYDITANMGPQYPSKGSKLTFTVDIPIDAAAAAASTEFLFKVWVMDIQLESDVAVGATSTSIPTAYGMVTSYGPGALIQASAYSTSSGAGSGRILQSYLTTAS
jgi:hypothetical protein